MKNELFHIGGLTIYGYGLMIAIAIMSAYLTVTYRAKKKGLEYEKIFNLTICCVVGGLLGAKLLYLITIIPDIIKDPKQIAKLGDGFVVYGGIIAGIASGFVYCKKHKWNFFEYFDLTMPSIALAQGFGRIGCFLAGCCYGRETNSWFAITFHNSSYAPNNVPLIPTQLLSSGLDFLHCGILLLIAKKNKVSGVIAGCYLMFYSVGRFVLEMFRGDLERGNVGRFSTSQFISIFLFIVGAALVIIRILQAKKTVTAESVAEVDAAEHVACEEDEIEDETSKESR
ncbi:MAG: prolipoprotein diacylglyceryl transferase [Clostridiales bacterium]|nr:prolipoprotein diacylglyceryl transferase [Clostridiales bacterium]